jgi:cell volume regulation protein A
MSPNVSYLGVLRKGEWIKAEQSPSFQLNDMLLVLSKAKDVKAVSDKVSTSAEQTSLDKLDFFGDFVLNGEITLHELDGFYSIKFAADQDPSQSLSEYITEKFHRRVVVGDQVQLDQLVLTVRQIDDHDQILQVGIKSA